MRLCGKINLKNPAKEEETLATKLQEARDETKVMLSISQITREQSETEDICILPSNFVILPHFARQR